MRKVERYIEQSGVPYTFLRPTGSCRTSAAASLRR